MKILFLLLSLLGSNFVFASEADQYNTWGRELEDVTDIVDEHFNREYLFNLEAVNHNAPKATCEQATFNVGLRLMIKGIKNTQMWIQDDFTIDQYPMSEDSHDLRDLSIYHGVKTLITHMAPTININGVYLGTDKLSHALGMGYTYYLIYIAAYNKALKKGSTPEAADKFSTERVIKYGVWTEKYLTGLINTGVFAFADLEANYQGFLFYKQFCHGESPRIKKVKGRWVYTRPFKIREMVNPRWDETYNVSTYKKRIKTDVKLNIAKFCDARNTDWVKDKFAYYKSIDTENQSSIYLKKMLLEGNVPDPAEYELDNICSN